MAKSIGSLVVRMEADLGQYRADMKEAGDTTRDMSKYATEAQFKASAAGKAVAQTAREAARARRAEATATRMVTREITTNLGMSDRLSRTVSNVARSFGAFGKNASAAQRQLAMTTVKGGIIVAGVQAWGKVFRDVQGYIEGRRWRDFDGALEGVNARLERAAKSATRFTTALGHMMRAQAATATATRESLDGSDAYLDALDKLEIEQARLALAQAGRSTEEIDRALSRTEAIESQKRAIRGVERTQEDAARALEAADKRAEEADKRRARLRREMAEAGGLATEAHERAIKATGDKEKEAIERAEKAAEKAKAATEAHEQALNDHIRAQQDAAEARQRIDQAGMTITTMRIDLERMLTQAQRQAAERRAQALETEKKKLQEIASIQRGGVGLVTGVGSVGAYRARREASADAGLAKLVETMQKNLDKSAFDAEDKQTFRDIKGYLATLASQEEVSI